jgi:imidazolonepropionase-like amidohydrolase
VAPAQIVGNLEAIRSATSVAVEIIGEAGVRATVSVGAKANRVVVAGDPVADLSLLLGQGEHILMAIKAGVCVKQAGQLLEPVAA